jgi:ectoine hydroxylase-related dioxygenase (phytanoyl-CoA dioxygenase family)
MPQELHTHWTDYYGPEHTNYYSIVPLFDMNRKTGATALVPGSHKLVQEIQAVRQKNWVGEGRDSRGRWGVSHVTPFMLSSVILHAK